MPTQTFLNLSQEKKDKIIEAIKREYARVPYEKVSINKIVEDANIARGSFYMYFEDKKDMLTYVLSSYHQEVISIITESFRRHHGDIFEVFTDILKFTASFGTAKENVDFCINIFSNQTVQNDILMPLKNQGRKNIFYDLFKNNIDSQGLDIHTPDELDYIIDILASVTQKSTADIFLYIDEKDEILKEYAYKISILKRGMLKEKL